MPLFKKRATTDGLSGSAAGAPPRSTTRNDNGHFLPKWVLGLRALQFILAVLVLALASYAQHVYRLEAAYIPAILAAVLTILIVLPLTLLHLLARGRMYNHKMAFLADFFATLLWLAVMTVLASYSHLFKPTRLVSDILGDDNFNRSASSYLRRIQKGWRAGAAATAFAGIEFLLFLITTLLFLKYYHAHRMSRTGTSNYAAGDGTAADYNNTPVSTIGQHGVGRNNNATYDRDFEMQHQPHMANSGNPVSPIGNAGAAPTLSKSADEGTHGGVGRSVV